MKTILSILLLGVALNAEDPTPAPKLTIAYEDDTVAVCWDNSVTMGGYRLESSSNLIDWVIVPFDRTFDGKVPVCMVSTNVRSQEYFRLKK